MDQLFDWVEFGVVMLGVVCLWRYLKLRDEQLDRIEDKIDGIAGGFPDPGLDVLGHDADEERDGDPDALHTALTPSGCYVSRPADVGMSSGLHDEDSKGRVTIAGDAA